MNNSSEPLLDRFYRYLGRIETSNHALLVAGILAGACSVISLAGTDLVFQYASSPVLPVVRILAYFLPFALVFGSSFLLIRGFALLDQRNKLLSQVADRDDLTRLASRSAFYRRGKEMATQATIQGSPLSLIMLDADHFKSINDRYGHLAGDLALKHMATILRDISRDNDLVARWGGEEFAILLRSASVAGARAFAERLRHSVASTPFYWEGKEVSLTLSAGVSEWSDEGDDFEALVLRADKALYVAKSSGRNQVHVGHVASEQIEGYVQDVEFKEALS